MRPSRGGVEERLELKASKLISKAGERPVLGSYISDGTPKKTAVQYVEPVEGVTSIHRRGKSLQEFFLQRAYFKTLDSDGEVAVEVLLADPKPLAHVKEAWHLFAACEAFLPLLPRLHRKGISISHYGFDRGCFSALSRHLLQRHEEFHFNDHSEDALTHAICDWQVCTACANHDCQNSLKWSCIPHLSNPKEGLSDLFITIESLRNSYDLLRMHLGFLCCRISFRDDPGEQNEDALRQFWVALGAEVEGLEWLVDLDPWWEEGRLWVGAKWRGQADVEEKVSNNLIYVFLFRRFAASRWCTQGPSCRSMVGSLAVGLEALVRHIRMDAQSSDFYLHGPKTLNPQRWTTKAPNRWTTKPGKVDH